MDESVPGRFEALLMRAFDGEASPAEREELAAWTESEPRLVELAELKAALLEALATSGRVDVAADVMAALDESAWQPLGDALREAVDAAPQLDLWGAISAGIEGEDDAAWTPFGEELRAAFTEIPQVDVAEPVMAAIAAEAEAAWAPTGDELRAAFAGIPGVNVTDAVMAAIHAQSDAEFASAGEEIRAVFRGLPSVDIVDAVMTAVAPVEDAVEDDSAEAEDDVVVALPMRPSPQVAERPRRAVAVWAPLIGFAMAAMALFALNPSGLVAPTPLVTAPVVTAPVAQIEVEAPFADFALAAVNDARVEDISSGDTVSVQVMQFDDGGPTFIIVEEGVEL